MGYLGQKYDKGLVIQRSPEGSAFQEEVNVVADGDTEVTPKVGGGLKKVNITGGGGSEVIANPELEGDEDALTGLEVDGVKYKVPEGGNDNFTNPPMGNNDTNTLNRNIVVNDSANTPWNFFNALLNALPENAAKILKEGFYESADSGQPYTIELDLSGLFSKYQCSFVSFDEEYKATAVYTLNQNYETNVAFSVMGEDTEDPTYGMLYMKHNNFTIEIHCHMLTDTEDPTIIFDNIESAKYYNQALDLDKTIVRLWNTSTELWQNDIFACDSNNDKYLLITFYGPEAMNSDISLQQIYDKLKEYQGGYEGQSLDLNEHSFYTNFRYNANDVSGEILMFIKAENDETYGGHWLRPAVAPDSTGQWGINIDEEAENFDIHVMSKQIS